MSYLFITSLEFYIKKKYTFYWEVSFLMTTQITLFKEKYYPHKCAYCGKGFEKKHNRQIYCSAECSHKAKQDQTAACMRKRRRLVREGKIIVSDQEKAKLGTSYFGYHRCEDFEKEYQAVIKEKRRLGL